MNADEHWHGTTCGHDFKTDVGAHTFDENDVCTTCNYTIPKTGDADMPILYAALIALAAIALIGKKRAYR